MIASKLGILPFFDDRNGKISDPYRIRTTGEKSKKSLVDLLPVILDELNCHIYLDGLDEVPEDRRLNFDREIQSFAKALSKAKVIVTCRSGAFVRNIHGFSIFEISPLDQNQVSKVASNWLEDPTLFFEELSKIEMSEICDRPILLGQAIIYFKKSGVLPNQPCKLYKNLAMLMLREWDEQRGIVRNSQYSGFTTDEKYDFLAHLSYQLTCIIKKKTFREVDLILAYKRIWRTFALPEREGKYVAQALESHTGIIVDAGAGNYQFSHLSLQEFFCAEFLVKAPFSDLRRRYFNEYPAPLAVAVALAFEPSKWLTYLVLEMEGAETAEAAATFIDRVTLEKPSFVASELLGYGVVKLLSMVGVFSMNTVNRFLANEAIAQSVAMFEAQYERDNGAYKKNLRGLTEFPSTNLELGDCILDKPKVIA